MPIYRVKATLDVSYELEIQADTEEEAYSKAELADMRRWKLSGDSRNWRWQSAIKTKDTY